MCITVLAGNLLKMENTDILKSAKQSSESPTCYKANKNVVAKPSIKASVRSPQPSTSRLTQFKESVW